MIFYDEQSNLNALLGEQLKETFQRIVKIAAKTMNVFQCAIVCLDKDTVEVVAKASSAHAPSFSVIPSFAGGFSPNSRFPLDSNFPSSSIEATIVFKQWVKTYFDANTFIRGKAHILDDKCIFVVAINVDPKRKDDADKLLLLDEWLSTELSKFDIEKADNKQNTLYEKLQSVANIGTWEVEFATNTLSWSSQTRKIHEVDSDFTPSLDSAIEFYREGFDRDEISRIVAHTAETGEPWSSTLRLVTAKGNTVWIETHGMAEMQNGECLRLFGTCQNVNKAVELRLALDQKRKEAEAVAAEKGALLARVSHELKTPLNGIVGMLEALKHEQHGGRREKKADFALRSADRLGNLINDVVDYTAIINQDFTLETTPFCIKALLDDVVGILEMRCEERGISFNTSLEYGAETYIQGDAARMAQVVKNVASFIIKRSELNGLTIHVALLHKKDNAVFHTSIEGSGPAMSEPAMRELFKPLMSAPQESSESRNDNGLALSTAKQLVTKMEGELSVSSVEHRGTCFDIVMPVQVVQNTQDVIESEVVFSSDLLRTTINVLIVDDNDINRLVLSSMFEDFHFAVDMAENGQIALEKARDKQYDLILMDLAMPVLDGYGATNGILSEKLLSEVGRIVAVTAHTAPGDRKACFEAGMTGFLSKPVAKNDVLSHVKQTLISKLTFA